MTDTVTISRDDALVGFKEAIELVDKAQCTVNPLPVGVRDSLHEALRVLRLAYKALASPPTPSGLREALMDIQEKTVDPTPSLLPDRRVLDWVNSRCRAALASPGDGLRTAHQAGLESVARYCTRDVRPPSVDDQQYRELIANIVEALEFASGQRASPDDGWVNVEEEMPPEGRIVLLFAIIDAETGNWKKETGSWRMGHIDEGPDAIAWSWGDRWLKSYDTKPTHWQYLPDVPPAYRRRPSAEQGG